MNTTDKRGKDLLLLIRDVILEEPLRFEIRLGQKFGRPGRKVNFNFTQKTVFPKCGTIACIAGWADILAYNTQTKKSWYSYGGIQDSAIELLGLNHSQAESLFYLNNWDEPFRTQYIKANRKRKARIAANYIEHFIKVNNL